jgi:hypothetical protein
MAVLLLMMLMLRGAVWDDDLRANYVLRQKVTGGD